MRLRLSISCAIAVASGCLCYLWLAHFHQGAADFGWALRAGKALLARRYPYDTPLEQYPMTAAVFSLPFAWLRPEIAAGCFYGISSGLLAFGLTRHGYWRLLIFLAYPYWAGLIVAQWAPFIMCAAFFPLLLPVTMAKPQVGLPVALTHLSKKGIFACVVVIALTMFLPKWFFLWLRQAGYYQHFIPLLVLPGPLLALALLRYRKSDAQFFLIAAIMPQRWFFDAFILWLIPKSRREIVWTVFFSWGAGLWRWFNIPKSYQQVGRWAVLCLYLPMLVVLLMRWWTEIRVNTTSEVPVLEEAR